MTDGGRLSTVHWQTAPIPNDGILQDSLFEFKHISNHNVMWVYVQIYLSLHVWILL